MSDYDRDSLGTRMKEFYENRSKSYLTRKVPVIIRVDGKSFHTFCKRFKKPFDECLNCMLAKTMQHLCNKVQGTIFAERHSDEISLLVQDWNEKAEIDLTDAYFDYSIQKICSVVAGTATAKFCKEMTKDNCCARYKEFGKQVLTKEDEYWPVFDCRCFNIPDEEVANYFWWRMLDAKRNSISMLAQSYFSHNELMNKSSDEQQEMVFQQTGINWGKLPQIQKIGNICYRQESSKLIEKGPQKGQYTIRREWVIGESPSSKAALDLTLDGIIHYKA